MIDLLLTDDLELDLTNGSLSTATDSTQIAQHVLARLRTFLGEWTFDTSAGVPYYEEILVKAPDLSVVDGYLKAAILGTPGVVELVSYSSVLDVGTRTLTVEAEYYDEYGRLNQLEEVI
jgi:hypothetical protein